jgi:GNAT superfamily N-acetyltransferase
MTQTSRAAGARQPGPDREARRKLVSGWASAPRVRARQAVPADLGTVGELAALAGARLEDQLAGAVTAGSAGAALRAGLRSGRDGFTRHMAEQFTAHSDDPLPAYLSAALVLAAEHRDHGIVGALIACPPSSVADDHLKQTQRTITDPYERGKLVMAGAVGEAKIKAVAVTETARGRNIGGSLLKRCRQVCFHCGYVVIYGQMPPVPGPDAFYAATASKSWTKEPGSTYGSCSASTPTSTLTRASASSSARRPASRHKITASANGCTDQYSEPPTSTPTPGPLQADTTNPAPTATRGWGRLKPPQSGQTEPS